MFILSMYLNDHNIYVYKFTTLRQIVFQILYLYDSCLCVYISINKIDVELLILVEASVCQINF